MVAAEIDAVLAEVGPRLRQLRTLRGITLVELSAETGISKSTLSRLESGQRKPSLELLLPIARAHRLPLDELVGAPEMGDPRVRLKPRARKGRVVVPLTEQPSGMHAWKVFIPPQAGAPEMRSHEGHEWIYVLTGELRVVVSGEDVTVRAGGAVEFDTGRPHWFGAAGDRPVEILSILSHRGEPLRVRAVPRRAKGPR